MKLFENRIEMVRQLVPRESTCAEIGVFEGAFSKQIIDTIQPKTLYMIDLFTGITCSGNEDGNDVVIRDMDGVYEALLVYAKTKPEAVLIKDQSSDALKTFADDSLDMVYIDGDHSYDGVKRDLSSSYPKVRPGGWIMGHDYEMNMLKARTRYEFGVKRAVDEFCTEHGLSIAAKALDGCVSFAIQVVK